MRHWREYITYNQIGYLREFIYSLDLMSKTCKGCFGMVHFIMDNHEDLQHPSNGQHFNCVIIIMMHLLHVHMLEIDQLMCNVRLGLIECASQTPFNVSQFGKPKILVTIFSYHVVFEVCFLNHAHWTTKWVPK